jgi:hypothetical protein
MKSRSGRILSPLLMLAILFPFGDGNMAQEKVTLTFVCCAENDLYLAVKAAGIRTQRYDSPEAALDAVPAACSFWLTDIRTGSLRSRLLCLRE